MTKHKLNPITLYVDNKSAIALIKNPIFHGHSNHIDTHFYFILEYVEKRQVFVEFICTGEKYVAILTKALSRIKFSET